MKSLFHFFLIKTKKTYDMTNESFNYLLYVMRTLFYFKIELWDKHEESREKLYKNDVDAIAQLFL